MKNSRRKEAALVAGGIILGASIAAPAAGAALTAQESSQRFVVDGKSVQIEAYSINGSNYAKIRDIGKAVGLVSHRILISNRAKKVVSSHSHIRRSTPLYTKKLISMMPISFFCLQGLR